MLGDIPAESLLPHQVAETGLSDKKDKSWFLLGQNLVWEEESKVSSKDAVLHVSQNLAGRQHVIDNIIKKQ